MNDQELKEKLVGSWRLRSFLIEKDGATLPWRDEVTGFLIYTADGSMSVAMNSRMDHEKDWFDSVLFYAGTWSVKDGDVFHTVLNATDVSNIGKILRRHVDFDGEVLGLSASGEFGYARVTWEAFPS